MYIYIYIYIRTHVYAYSKTYVQQIKYGITQIDRLRNL